MQQLRKWAELLLSIVFTALGEFMAWLNLESLQKIYYLLASLLMFIAIWKLLANKQLKVEKLSQAASIVDQAHDPEERAKTYISFSKKIKKGVIHMLEKIKAFGWVRLVTILLEITFLALGVLSAYVPELLWIQENLISLFTLMGLTGVVAAWAQGKELGSEAKKRDNLKKRKHEIKAENKKLNEMLKVLDLDYAYLTPFVDRLMYGGELTKDQQQEKNIYDTQRKGILDKIDALDNELSEIDSKLKSRGEVTDD